MKLALLVGHARCMDPTRQHELDHTDHTNHTYHTDHTYQELIYIYLSGVLYICPEISKS